MKWEEKSMRGYVTSLLAASIVVLVGGSTVGCAAGISDGVVKIGILTDMGGPLSDAAGKGSVVAAQLAADDFGGKVLGAPVQIVSADHQGKPDIASSLARAWFELDHVDAVNDLVLSGVALAVANVAKQLNRIALVNGAATDRLTNEECAPTTVHFAYDTYSIAQAISDTTIKQGGKKWFFIAVDTAGGKALEQVTSQFVKKNGGEVLGSIRYPSGTTDFSSYVLAAQASNADVIGLAMSGSELSDVIKTVKEFGLKQRLAATVALITDVHAVGLKIAQGMYIATAFYWDTDEATRAFSKRFFAKMSKMPTDVQAGVYSSTLLYLNSIKAAGTDDTNAVLAEMRKQKINDIFKNGYLREDGNVVHDMYLTQVKSPEESKYPWDYARVVTTIPGEQAYQPLSENRCPSLKK
jgi:branched-chain amino acid transport system substrate-binding protein